LYKAPQDQAIRRNACTPTLQTTKLHFSNGLALQATIHQPTPNIYHSHMWAICSVGTPSGWVSISYKRNPFVHEWMKCKDDCDYKILVKVDGTVMMHIHIEPRKEDIQITTVLQ